MVTRTPIGTLHWYLVKFRPSHRASIFITHTLYLATYALARVYLIYGIVRVYGAWLNLSTAEAFLHLRWHCQLGTSVIGGSNASWLLGGLRKFVRKYIFGGPKAGPS